ncbi:MAG: hypothetical protein R3B60_02585 [Candidatus Paceibacterota bacterium]
MNNANPTCKTVVVLVFNNNSESIVCVADKGKKRYQLPNKTMSKGEKPDEVAKAVISEKTGIKMTKGLEFVTKIDWPTNRSENIIILYILENKDQHQVLNTIELSVQDFLACKHLGKLSKMLRTYLLEKRAEWSSKKSLAES